MSIPEEIFDVVDEHDVIVGQMSRQEVHRRGLRHRAVHILVFNSKGELFLQRRSYKKECAPGLWDSSVAGHLQSRESYDTCALRELKEELGLTLQRAPTRLFKLEACRDTGWEFVWVYHCQAEGPFRLDPDEIAEAHWFSPATIDLWMRDRPEEFSGTLRLIWPLIYHPVISVTD